MPAISRSAVVLPAPLRPTMPSDSPRLKLRLSSRTAQRSTRARGPTPSASSKTRVAPRCCPSRYRFQTPSSSTSRSDDIGQHAIDDAEQALRQNQGQDAEPAQRSQTGDVRRMGAQYRRPKVLDQVRDRVEVVHRSN